MSSWRLLSASDQVTAHLRRELLRGRWSGLMPGIHRLATALRVNRKPVEAALSQLELEGFLVPQGAGRKRRIVLPEDAAPPALRVEILLYEESDRMRYDTLAMMHQLELADLSRHPVSP